MSSPNSCRWGSIALSGLLLFGYGCGPSIDTNVQQSHVDANVPAGNEFKAFMDRDLRRYFDESRGRPGHRVATELLRDGPTQSGVGYPKFYVWVAINGGTSADDRGAVRLAAIDKQRFEVTDFFSEAALRADSQAMIRTFPVPVCDLIATKLK